MSDKPHIDPATQVHLKTISRLIARYFVKFWRWPKVSSTTDLGAIENSKNWGFSFWMQWEAFVFGERHHVCLYPPGFTWPSLRHRSQWRCPSLVLFQYITISIWIQILVLEQDYPRLWRNSGCKLWRPAAQCSDEKIVSFEFYDIILILHLLKGMLMGN